MPKVLFCIIISVNHSTIHRYIFVLNFKPEVLVFAVVSNAGTRKAIDRTYEKYGVWCSLLGSFVDIMI